MLLLTSYMFARANVISDFNDVDFTDTINVHVTLLMTV